MAKQNKIGKELDSPISVITNTNSNKMEDKNMAKKSEDADVKVRDPNSRHKLLVKLLLKEDADEATLKLAFKNVKGFDAISYAKELKEKGPVVRGSVVYGIVRDEFKKGNFEHKKVDAAVVKAGRALKPTVYKGLLKWWNWAHN